MILAAFSIFAVSAAAIGLMIIFRIWEIRIGRISVPDEAVPENLFSIDRAEAVAEEFFAKFKVFFYHALSLLVSHLAVFLRQAGDEIGREWKKLSTSLPKHFPQPSQPAPRGGSSVYLKDITARKDEIRRENGYHE